MSETHAVRELLSSPQTLATVVHAIMREKYGEDAYDWDILTTFMQVQEDFKVEMSSAVTNRWGAIQVVMTTDGFFSRPDAFLAICNTLTTGNPFFDVFNPVTLEEAAWGISEVSLNREMLPFNYGVRKYIKMLLGPDGYSAQGYPDVFRLALEDPDAIREELIDIQTNPNNDVLEEYIEDQLRDMASQFNRVPSMAHIDDLIMSGEGDRVIAEL
jgi:hypothetical protein